MTGKDNQRARSAMNKVLDNLMIQKLFNLSVLAFIFSIPVYPGLSSKLLILAVFISLFVGRQEDFLKNILLRSWDMLLFILVLLLGTWYSENFVSAIIAQENKLAFLGVAILLLRTEVTGDFKLRDIFLSFSIGLFLTCIICLTNSIFLFLASNNINDFFSYSLTSVVKSHPTYLAYYLIAAITYALYALYYEETYLKRNWLIGLISFFFVMLLLTGGKTAYMSILLIFSFYLLKFLTEKSLPSKKRAFILVSCLLGILLLVNSWEYFDKQELNNDYWERHELWKAAIQANVNPLTGVGTGNYKQVLNQYYISHGMDRYAKENYNAHNQFAQIYLSNGLLGLLSLILLIFRPLYLSVMSKNILGILLLFPFIIYGVSEVFLGRYQGVIFFALLHQLLIYQYYTLGRAIPIKPA